MLRWMKWAVPLLIVALVASPAFAAKAKGGKKKAAGGDAVAGKIVSVSGNDITVKASKKANAAKKGEKSAKKEKTAKKAKGEKKPKAEKKAGKAKKGDKKKGNVLHLTADTKVTVNGKAATAKDLHAGQKIKATVTGGNATKVDATDKGAKKADGAKKAKKAGKKKAK